MVKFSATGGDITIAKKYKEPLQMACKIPFYIATNELPNFGSAQNAIEDRLDIFPTVEHPIKRGGMDR